MEVRQLSPRKFQIVMLLKIIYYFLFLKVIESQNNFNLTVDYFVNVIEDGEAEALVYTLPENAYEYKPTNSNKLTEYGTFDYIIVGSGSAGSVIATRLSEERNLSILLIDAGDDENSFVDIPSQKIFASLSKYNWNYVTVPQNTCCLGMVNSRCPIPRGKALGGSTVINAMMYVRGNKKDYDTWAHLGNPGWSYEDVLPYFIVSENSQIDGDAGYHGVGGLLNVQYHRPYSPQFYAFIDANVELGRKILDYNGKQQLGAAYVQLNVVNGRRLSVARAFLAYSRNRNNLKVLKNAFVTKILINKQTKEAYGVQFSYNKQIFVARAAKEVILSAGAIGSPQLLMLSGIGPTAHLKKHKIPVIQDLQVGQYYKDHPAFYGLFYHTNYTEPIRSTAEYVQQFLQGSGPHTIADNSQGVAFLQTKLMKVPGVPDIEIMMIPANATDDSIQRSFHYTDETYNAIWAKLDRPRTFSHFIILLHEKSFGTVTLRSSNPYDYPLIDARYLSDPKNEDIERMYQGIQLSLEIVNTTAFKKLNATLVDATLPACRSFVYLSKDYWYCQIRQLTMHMYHPTGTCRMGPNPLNGSVVDHNLRVHGIKRLRVADASIMPSTLSGHTGAPTIMIGEKLSNMLRNKTVNQSKNA